MAKQKTKKECAEIIKRILTEHQKWPEKVFTTAEQGEQVGVPAVGPIHVTENDAIMTALHAEDVTVALIEQNKLGQFREDKKAGMLFPQAIQEAIDPPKQEPPAPGWKGSIKPRGGGGKPPRKKG